MNVSQDIRDAKAFIDETSGQETFTPREVREMRDRLIAMTYKAEFEHILRRELSKECGPSVFAHAMKVATTNMVSKPRNEFEAAIDAGVDMVAVDAVGDDMALTFKWSKSGEKARESVRVFSEGMDMLADAPVLDRRFAEIGGGM